MGKWLSALRAPHEKSQDASTANPQNLQNPYERGIEGFEGRPPGHLQKIHEGSDATDWQFAFEERAAILEYDGGMTRADAEELAAEEIAIQRGRHLQ